MSIKTKKYNFDVELLISLVEKEPALWDPSLTTYKCKSLRDSTWHKICNELNEDFEVMGEKKKAEYIRLVTRKWNQLRDSMIRSIDVIKGKGNKSGRKYIFHDQMSFLIKVLTPDVGSDDEVKQMNSERDQDDSDDDIVTFGEQNEESLSSAADDSSSQGKFVDGTKDIRISNVTGAVSESSMSKMVKYGFDVELLMSLVEQQPVIWDQTLEKYRETFARTAAWREVCQRLIKGFDEMPDSQKAECTKLVVKKWNQLRDSMMRSLTQKKTARKYVFHDKMSFLIKLVKPDLANLKREHVFIEIDDNEDNDYNIENYEESEPESSHDGSDQGQFADGAKRIKISNVKEEAADTIDPTMVAYIDQQIQNEFDQRKEERNLLFFKSLLPTVASLEEDEILEFQEGVLGLLRRLKKRKSN